MIEQQLAEYCAGKLPFGVFIFSTATPAGFIAWHGVRYLVFTPEALHVVGMKGSEVKNTLRFTKHYLTIPWPEYQSFGWNSVNSDDGHYFHCLITANQTKFKWQYAYNEEEGSQNLLGLDKALFFYRNAGPQALEAWWNDAMQDATADRDPKDYLYLMDRHFSGPLPA